MGKNKKRKNRGFLSLWRDDGFSYWERNKKGDAIFPLDFVVSMSSAVYKKLFSFVRASNLEVSGLGLVKQEENRFEIYDVFVLEQESSGGGTTLDGKAISDLMLKMIKEKKEVGNLRFWWHSHPHFGTFWSGTDDATCERLVKDSFLIAWVVNHEYSIRCRIDLRSPFRVTLDDVPIEVEGRKDKRIDAGYRKEAEGKVKGCTYEYLGYKRDREFNIEDIEETKVGGQTLFVNPITKQSSYNKEEVLFKEGGVGLFSRVMIQPGIYECIRRAPDYKSYVSEGWSVTLKDDTKGIILEKEDVEGNVVVSIWFGRLIKVSTKVLV